MIRQEKNHLKLASEATKRDIQVVLRLLEKRKKTAEKALLRLLTTLLRAKVQMIRSHRDLDRCGEPPPLFLQKFESFAEMKGAIEIFHQENSTTTSYLFRPILHPIALMLHNEFCGEKGLFSRIKTASEKTEKEKLREKHQDEDSSSEKEPIDEKGRLADGENPSQPFPHIVLRSLQQLQCKGKLPRKEAPKTTKHLLLKIILLLSSPVIDSALSKHRVQQISVAPRAISFKIVALSL